MIILKIGGGETINIEGIAKDISSIREKFIVVHGANTIRDKIAKSIGKPKKVLTSVSGYTSVYSDKDAIDILMMSYAGLQNKRVVETLQKHGVNAVGLSGIDGRTIQGKRNTGIRVKENGKTLIKRDFSGKPRAVNKTLLELLLKNGYVPVLCVPIIDEQSCAINSENDDILNVIENSFHANKIVQLIEAPGFLDDKNDASSLVKKISRNDLKKRESQVQGRMKRKMLALKKLFEEGASTVIIGDGRTDHPLKDALDGKGTVIQ